MVRLGGAVAALLVVTASAFRRHDRRSWGSNESAPADTAICIAGRAEQPKSSLPSLLEHVIKPLQAAVFVSTGTDDQTYLRTVRSILPEAQITTKSLNSSKEIYDKAMAALPPMKQPPPLPNLLRVPKLRDFLHYRKVCADMIEQSEAIRGRKYTYVKVVRPDLVWLVDHAPLDVLFHDAAKTLKCFTTFGRRDWEITCTRSAAISLLRAFTAIARDPPYAFQNYDLTGPGRFLESFLKDRKILRVAAHSPFVLACPSTCDGQPVDAHVEAAPCVRSSWDNTCAAKVSLVVTADTYARLVTSCGWERVHSDVDVTKISMLEDSGAPLPPTYFSCGPENPLHASPVQ